MREESSIQNRAVSTPYSVLCYFIYILEPYSEIRSQACSCWSRGGPSGTETARACTDRFSPAIIMPPVKEHTHTHSAIQASSICLCSSKEVEVSSDIKLLPKKEQVFWTKSSSCKKEQRMQTAKRSCEVRLRLWSEETDWKSWDCHGRSNVGLRRISKRVILKNSSLIASGACILLTSNYCRSKCYVYRTVRHCDSWRIGDQLDVTCC